MKTAKMIIYRLIHPANWILCFLPPFSFAHTHFYLCNQERGQCYGIPDFVLSAYSLIILIAALPLLAGRLKQVKAKFWNHSRLIKKIFLHEFGNEVFERPSVSQQYQLYQGMDSQLCLYAVPVCDRYSIPLCMVFLDGGLLSGSVCDEGTPCIQLPMP